MKALLPLLFIISTGCAMIQSLPNIKWTLSEPTKVNDQMVRQLKINMYCKGENLLVSNITVCQLDYIKSSLNDEKIYIRLKEMSMLLNKCSDTFTTYKIPYPKDCYNRN